MQPGHAQGLELIGAEVANGAAVASGAFQPFVVDEDDMPIAGESGVCLDCVHAGESRLVERRQAVLGRQRRGAPVTNDPKLARRRPYVHRASLC